MIPVASTIRKWQRHWLDGMVRSYFHGQLEARAEGFVSVFEPFLASQSQILDIGGGWGFYSDPLQRRGHDVTVLDVVKPGYQKAPLVIYDGGRIPFEDKSFDASLLVTVLHHVGDPEALILEARRVTRKTLVLIEDVYHHGPGRLWTSVRDRFYNFEFFGHPCRFRKSQEWIETFERSGFRLKEKREMYTWLAGVRILNAVFVFDLE